MKIKNANINWHFALYQLVIDGLTDLLILHCIHKFRSDRESSLYLRRFYGLLVATGTRLLTLTLMK